jgi:hypothetical protein
VFTARLVSLPNIDIDLLFSFFFFNVPFSVSVCCNTLAIVLFFKCHFFFCLFCFFFFFCFFLFECFVFLYSLPLYCHFRETPCDDKRGFANFGRHFRVGVKAVSERCANNSMAMSSGKDGHTDTLTVPILSTGPTIQTATFHVPREERKIVVALPTKEAPQLVPTRQGLLLKVAGIPACIFLPVPGDGLQAAVCTLAPNTPRDFTVCVGGYATTRASTRRYLPCFDVSRMVDTLRTSMIWPPLESTPSPHAHAWPPASAKQVHVFDPPNGPQASGGGTVVSCSMSLVTAQRVSKFRHKIGMTSRVTCLAVSPDGTRVAICSPNTDGSSTTLRTSAADFGKPKFRLIRGSVTAIIYSNAKDGRRVLALLATDDAGDQSLRVVHENDERDKYLLQLPLVNELELPDGKENRLCRSLDGRLVVCYTM